MRTVASLAARGLQAGVDLYQTADRNNHVAGNDGDVKYQLPRWGMVLIGATVILFCGLNFMIEYTYGRVVPTLLMIESPETLAFEPLKSNDPDSKLPPTPEDSELLLVKQAPITSSFRSTIRHLRNKAGRLSRFRGFSIYMISGFMTEWYIKVIATFIPVIFAPFLAMFLCAPFYLTWTHVVISEPSSKTWFKRLPDMQMIKKVLVPTAHYALAKELTIFMPTYLATSYGLHNINFETMTKHEATMTVAQSLSVLALAGALAFLVLIPANVTLTRVQASLLQENEEAIVPFDRTYGGKVIPEILGGKGVLGMLDAWKTFDWNSRIRLLKAYGKVFAMETALTFAFFIVIASEIFMIMGDDLKKFIPKDKGF